MKLERQLQQFGSAPFSRSALLTVLAGYQRPNDKIMRWIKDGTLVQLKKGVYVLGPEWRTHPVSLPLVANNLYGPSCVSLEWALAFHGLIPEGVFEVTSVTSRRAKQYDTPLGRFSYQHIPAPVVLVGASMEAANGQAHCLVAGPTKALCDKVLLTRNLRLSSVPAMQTFLEEDLRLDPDAMSSMDRNVLRSYAAAGRKVRLVKLLSQALEQWV